MVTSYFRPEVEIRPFRACAMHPAVIIGTVRSLRTWLSGRYHVPQNVFLVGVKSSQKRKRNILSLRSAGRNTFHHNHDHNMTFASPLTILHSHAEQNEMA